MAKQPIVAAGFSARTYAVDAEVEEVLAAFSNADRGQIDAVEQQLANCSLIDPSDLSRRPHQNRIVDSYFSIQAVQAATPQAGVAPQLTLLGGRGGSGKSWFKAKAYNPNLAIVVDADDIKKQIPEFNGWNAGQVHEESTALADRILTDTRALGLNVVLDATMKTSANTMLIVRQFANAGYVISAFYMFLPRQKAAHRAVERFLGPTGRYVPVSVVLANTENERTFDDVKQAAVEWAFYDNDVALGQNPILIAHDP